MGRGLRAAFLLMGILAVLMLGIVALSIPAAIEYERESVDLKVLLSTFYAGALAVAGTIWLLVSARHPQSPRWLSVLLLIVAVPGLCVGLVVAALSILAIHDPVSVFVLVPAILCALTALFVLRREFPRVSAVQDERYSSRWAGGKGHDAV